MPKCRFCNYDVHPSIGQCPQCGAPVDKPNADLEQPVRSLLDQGQKIEAVKLYKDQTGVSLAEAKEAVEAMQADAGPPPLPDIADDLKSELLGLLGEGKKLEAIKLSKERYGTSHTVSVEEAEHRARPLIGEEEIEYDAEEIENMRKDDIRQCTRDLLLVERARDWLLAERPGGDEAKP